MLRVQFRERAPSGTTFSPDALIRSIGRDVPVARGRRQWQMATLISVEVIEDGAAILLTVECSDEVAQLFEGTESKVRQGPPAHDLTMPHDILFNPDKARGCPPNCPYRKWTEAQNDD